MSYDWVKSATRAQRMLTRFGAPCVVRSPLPAQPGGQNGGRPWDTGAGSRGSPPPLSAGVPSVCVRTRFDRKDVDGVNVLRTDVLLLLAPAVEPSEGGSVEFDGVTYYVINPGAVSPAGVVLLYKVQGRA